MKLCSLCLARTLQPRVHVRHKQRQHRCFRHRMTFALVSSAWWQSEESVLVRDMWCALTLLTRPVLRLYARQRTLTAVDTKTQNMSWIATAIATMSRTLLLRPENLPLPFTLLSITPPVILSFVVLLARVLRYFRALSRVILERHGCHGKLRIKVIRDLPQGWHDSGFS